MPIGNCNSCVFTDTNSVLMVRVQNLITKFTIIEVCIYFQYPLLSVFCLPHQATCRRYGVVQL